jgi:hypothetical protein
MYVEINGTEIFASNPRPSYVRIYVTKENSWPYNLDHILHFWVKVVNKSGARISQG